MTEPEKTGRRPLVIVAGPTAVGKTKGSIALAKEIGGEIVSADSMQVYRGLNIGSAKIRPEETEGVPHHLIDVLDPSEEFSVMRFQEMAKEAMAGIYERGRVPIIVGGTGFYIQSVLYDVDFAENPPDKSYRRELERRAKEGQEALLFEELRAVDPDSCLSIDPHNVKRVIRALEYFQETGEPISRHNARERAKESPYDFDYFVLTMDRQKLYLRIEARVDQMMEEGLLEEVRRLKNGGAKAKDTAMQGLGYKQLYAYLEGKMSLEEAVAAIKQETRHFAKRQLTWFRREKDAVWVDVEKEDLLNVYRTRHQR